MKTFSLPDHESHQVHIVKNVKDQPIEVQIITKKDAVRIAYMDSTLSHMPNVRKHILARAEVMSRAADMYRLLNFMLQYKEQLAALPSIKSGESILDSITQLVTV